MAKNDHDDMTEALGDTGAYETSKNVIEPDAQETIPFYGRPLVAARLPDGDIAVFLLWLCEGLSVHPQAQVRRIRRTEAIADDLVIVRADTGKGVLRPMPALRLRSLPFFLAGISTQRVRDDVRPVLLTYQRECVDVLYRHFAQHPARSILPSTRPPVAPVAPTQPPRPTTPPEDAPLTVWASYHRAMLAFIDWQQAVEVWREGIEGRLESVEEVARLVPELIERLGPQTIDADQQRAVQMSIKQRHDRTGLAYATLYGELIAAFGVPRYTELHAADWPRITAWLASR